MSFTIVDGEAPDRCFGVSGTNKMGSRFVVSQQIWSSRGARAEVEFYLSTLFNSRRTSLVLGIYSPN